MEFWTRMLCVSVILALLTGCAPAQTPTVPATAPPETTVQTTAAPIREVTVSDHTDKTFTWTDLAGNPCTVRFRIPALSSPATDTARQILDTCLPQLEELERAMAEKYSPPFTEVNYHSVTASGIVSILIWTDTGTNYVIYHNYNVDAATGEPLADEDLLRYMGIEKTQWDQALRSTAERAFARFYPDADMSSDAIRQVYEATVSTENLLNAKLYLTADGKLGAVLNVYSVAGADFYPQLAEDITRNDGF